MLHKNRLLEEFFAPLLREDTDKLEQLRASIVLKKNTRYFDWTASGLASILIEQRVKKLLPYYANAHSEASTHASLMCAVYERSKEVVKKSLGLGEDFALLATGFGATAAIKKFQEIMGIYIPPKTKQLFLQTKTLKSLPKVFVGPYEHHSNEISFREGLCAVQRIPLNAEGLLDIQEFERCLQSHRGAYASFSVASNVTGVLSPCEKLSALCRQYGAILALDMASSSAYMNINASLFDACFLSSHKLLGGVGGSGLLGIRKDLIDTSLPPSFSGGGVVKYVNRKTQEYIQDIQTREEAGTLGLLQMYRSALAYMLRDAYSLNAIRRREHILTQTLLHELASIPALRVYGNLSAERLGIVSFNVGGVSPYDLAYSLSQTHAIQTRAGCSCAGPYGHDLLEMKDLNSQALKSKPGWLRVSLHYTHSLEDIEYLVDCLKQSIKRLRGA
ncbi:cysteine desulfurase [Helicobacter sp. 12S02634-8]|uniref:aminotransferase class V-fold PLP-dependent enzyme n=1 Tax=Helicobacter sp. 12S02634-8 TaxID=1476199 RepID=UPI000BA64441|nr:aminotransferase class V-fold PLP-dependent enzyme [Helicobacter sp. 12S02634-8]PAF47355.1 cysteine desulfurase [Helicobacter sp. 12S02634-8]